MLKGDVVTVYHDPYTESEAEGGARLVRRVMSRQDSDLVELWTVRFLSDGAMVDRLIRRDK